MGIGQHIKITIKSLASNKFRTFLTMLGIIIGVMAIIALLGIGKGAQDTILSSFDTFGANTIFVTPGSDEGGIAGGVSNMGGGFSIEEVDEFIARDKKYIKSVTGKMTTMFFSQTEDGEATTMIEAYYGDVSGIDVQSGQMIDGSDNSRVSKVAVIGSELVDSFFMGENPIGSSIKINGINFKIIGITEERTSTNFENPNSSIIVPFSAYDRYLLPVGTLPFLTMEATDSAYTKEAVVEVEEIMREVRNLSFEEADNFTVRSSEETLGIVGQVTSILTWFLVAIASVSLLVGGIGVMNIMFVSISERTKEIGLRKSLGAKNKDIMIQFLTESLVVSMIGGTLGIILGVTLSIIASGLLDLSGSGIYLDSIAIGIVFSVLIGLVFGIYPAKKAAKMSPIEALRFD